MSCPDLRQLALSGGDYVVAINDGYHLTANELAVRVSALATALRARPEQRWGLWYENSVDFLCAFLGLAQAGKAVVLPHNMQPGSAAELSRYMDAMLTDVVIDGLLVDQYNKNLLAGAIGTMGDGGSVPVEMNSPASADPVCSGDISVTLFTSGTTGQPQPVLKTLALLETELAVLQQAFGEQVTNMPVLATVSHQHIYGLLHKLLWPLYRGAVVINRHCQYPEQLLELAAHHGPVLLVSSPSHLTRLPESAAFRQSGGHIAVIISSGALLQNDAASALRRVCAAPVLEVFGSTETGGVAWRNQAASSLWQALPQVRVSTDVESGCLAVNSGHLGSAQAFVMGDKVDFSPDGRFSLSGRADTVVKVEGKRLSLTEMEQRLAEHPMVKKARLAVLRGRRDKVGAVVVLSPAGQRALAAGKHRMNQVLRKHLAAFFELPVLPRRWRYIESFPINTQGKVLATDIMFILQTPERITPPESDGDLTLAGRYRKLHNRLVARLTADVCSTIGPTAAESAP